MSKLYVEPLKNPNVELNVKSSGMVFVVADNINEESVFVTPSKTAVVGPLKETLTQPDVASGVTTSLAQPDHIKFESESESAFDNGKSQCKMVSVGDEKDGSESDDQSVWSLLLFWSYVMLLLFWHAWLVCHNLWLKGGVVRCSSCSWLIC